MGIVPETCRTAFHRASAPASREGLLQVWVAFSGLALLGATWRLWTSAAAFPQVPLWGGAVELPEFLDVAALGVVLASLAMVLITSAFLAARPCERIRRAAWAAFLVAMLPLITLDQHRLQPWVWQFLLLSALFAARPPGGSLRWAGVLVIGLYAHSAVSKLDQSFLATHGPELVNGLLRNFGASLPASGNVRTVAALALPLGELAVAMLLLFPKTRRIGLPLSVVMHLLLILALGPWGLNHRPGVLMWNLFFIGQNLLVFRNRTDSSVVGDDGLSLWRSPRRLVPIIVVALGVLLPIAGWFGRLDPWLGWEVYASRPARMRVFVRDVALARLPRGLQPFVAPPRFFEEWRRVRIDLWSLDALRAPISPQVRFQVGVVRALIRGSELGDDVQLEWESDADRFTGRRVRRVFQGAREIDRWASEFSWNTDPDGFEATRP